MSPATHNTPQRSFEASSTSSNSAEGGAIRAFSPNFDVHETSKEYILEGELPGLEDKKKNLSIEFNDNTLVVRGKIEKSYTHGTHPSGGAIAKMKGAITKSDEKEGGETKSTKHDDDQVKYWVSERTVGSFQRSFNFPGEIDQDGVKASLEHGILKIVVPKTEKKAARKIDIS